MPTQNSGENSEKRWGRPENLTPWKPGQSGNPGGRHKKKPLTEALEKIYSDPEECMAAARALAKKARKGVIIDNEGRKILAVCTRCRIERHILENHSICSDCRTKRRTRR